ncbi:hypothetical protein GQ55_9G363500 [Panicum hallii var. hallii]|uniref:Disease resistance N-terminal domain-containing protein n=1 Tax=Panicum hallii var. hallii TaxID=1504633 RepID=A0A2T7C8U8_9POAL|nr:hypothetical protein GQ55_9G363500 [Panicum hallii var. hallii]
MAQQPAGARCGNQVGAGGVSARIWGTRGSGDLGNGEGQRAAALRWNQVGAGAGKYKTEEQLEKKMKRLQDLLIRAHMIVEEAEDRYITNSKMLLQLKKLVEVMYQGYHVLDTIKFRTLCSSRADENEQENIPPFAPAVLPIIGGSRVGKKTLVAHVCKNEKVRSKFSTILHMHGENIRRIAHEVGPGRSLVVVEFTSDVDEEDWLKFYSSVKKMGRGSKIIIISRIAKLSRFWTVKPVRLNGFSQEEYSYLFKVLAFGGTNPEEHPQLAVIAEDLAVALGGSLITANVCADMMRKNQDVHFWISLLKKYRNVVMKNFSVFGEHPKNLMDQDHPIDITRLASSSRSSLPSSATLRLMPPHSEVDNSKTEFPKVMFGDLIAGSAVLPREGFELVAWESRIPPYKRFVNFAAYYDEEPISQHHTASAGKKRKRFDK